MAEQSKKKIISALPHEYGCEILLQKTTLDKVKDPSFPNDAYCIWYKVDEDIFMDLTRCRKRSDLFDMYYDTYGSGAVQKIDFGYGRTNPKLWGIKSTEKNKKR